MEANLMYLNTSATKYTPTVGNTITADEQTFFIPPLHYVSPKLRQSGARVGLSVVVPGGLSRKWKNIPAVQSSEEFSLQIVEINPTAAFQVSDTVGVAVGFRIAYSSGVVKATPAPSVVSVDMKGDSLDFGYNLALTYQPTKELKVGLTYRSKINLTESGTADLAHPALPNGIYDASVSIPLPASLNAAIAYTFPTDTTVEFVYETTYLSSYKNLDFDYTNSTAEAVFGDSKAKNWKDTSAYRIGITQELDAATIMAGFVYDETAVSESTLNFESPGSAAISFSLGGRYKIDDSFDVGLSALYSMKDDRKVSTPENQNGINGEFTDSNVLIVSAGIGYKF